MKAIKDVKDIVEKAKLPREHGVKLKICGMKYPENIASIATLQPDYFGFIFYDKSSRYFEGQIPELPTSIKKVGVFVDATIRNILSKADRYGLNVVQLHGEESAAFSSKLKNQLPANVDIIKVFSIKDQFDFGQLKAYESATDYFLFDTQGKFPGGNGYTFNWNALINYPSTTPYFLSGGIGLDELENLRAFFEQPQSQFCYAIDVNSKFEIEAGLKDIVKLERFKQQMNR